MSRVYLFSHGLNPVTGVHLILPTREMHVPGVLDPIGNAGAKTTLETTTELIQSQLC